MEGDLIRRIAHSLEAPRETPSLGGAAPARAARADAPPSLGAVLCADPPSAGMKLTQYRFVGTVPWQTDRDSLALRVAGVFLTPMPLAYIGIAVVVLFGLAYAIY